MLSNLRLSRCLKRGTLGCGCHSQRENNEDSIAPEPAPFVQRWTVDTTDVRTQSPNAFPRLSVPPDFRGRNFIAWRQLATSLWPCSSESDMLMLLLVTASKNRYFAIGYMDLGWSGLIRGIRVWDPCVYTFPRFERNCYSGSRHCISSRADCDWFMSQYITNINYMYIKFTQNINTRRTVTVCTW